MKVKLFWKSDPVGKLLRRSARKAHELEDEINEWLAEHPGIEVVEIHQAATGGRRTALWFISLWYEEGRKGKSRR